MARGWWRWIQGIAGALVVVFVVRHLARNWEAVRAAPIAWSFAPGWLILSLALVLGTYAVLVESWRRMLAGWGPRLGWWESARVWVLSSMGKYLPGKIWAVAGMAMLAQRRGAPPWAATASAILLQVVSIATGAVIVGVTSLGALESAQPGSEELVGLILALALAGLAAVLWPPVATRLVGLVPGKREERVSPSPGAVAFGIAANAAAWITYGLALWLLARGVLPAAGLEIADAIGAFAASYIAGLLFLLAPGGLGVRESVLVILLSPRVGLANALALAAVSRLGMTAADILAVLPFIRAWKETARHAA
ncbi:MAG TPA: lysylphosphatidylglycerol synthase domain-containing protein [Gemmatimonadales bacterium]